jgi:hypothetical protein
MIRRNAGNDFLLITQHDHALFSGELARRFGNAAFAAPAPFAETVAAVAHHDCGWPLHDDRPTLSKEGLPLHVFEVPGKVAVEVWSASVSRALGLGDWQGLLVSLHVLNLSAFAMSHWSEPSRADVFEMNKFQHRQIEVQEGLRRTLGLRTDVPLQLGLAAPGASAADDQLSFDFRVLTLLDRISLSLCCGKLLFPVVDDVMGRPGEGPVEMKLAMGDDATMTVDPWPFDRGEIVAEVPARRVRAGAFGGVEEFREAYAGARVESMKLVVKPSESI